MRKVSLIVSILMLIAATIGTRSAVSAGDNQRSEEQKIQALISIVRDLKDATFIRNGKEYDCQAAAHHMQLKWSYAKGQIKTARQFIDKIASASSQSGKPYLIRFKDGQEIKSGDFLSERLDRLESESRTPATAPASTSRQSSAFVIDALVA